jgi:23S rRNA pseudouridine2605 synthase
MTSKNEDRGGGGGDRMSGDDRIAKVMARAGLCSRRDAEVWIAEGRVAVNGGTISSPAVNVTARDRITVDGKPLPRRERTRLFLYYKPVGLVSTNADPEGRPTVFDALPENLPRLMSIGRLDIGTEGLLLLTNDGGLARALELPDTGWVRRYRVRAHGHVTQGELDKLRDGITVDGIHYGPIDATLERDQGANIWLSFAIREGKNREVRNVLTHLGLQVNRLIRVEFGPFGLGDLPEGAIEEVETQNLRKQLGDSLIGQAGCDFSGPVTERSAVAPDEPKRRGSRAQDRPNRRLSDRGTDRDRPRDRTERSATPRDRDDRKPPQRKSRRDTQERPDKPPGRPRRGHAWRQEDAPLRRTYRGSRREDLKIAAEERPDKRAGLLTDQKGRRVLVERFGTKKEKPEPATPLRTRTPRGPPRDRSAGPRPARPRFAGERAAESRSTGERELEPRRGSSRSDAPRGDRPRSGAPGKFPPGNFGEGSKRSGTDRPGKSRSGLSDQRPPRSAGAGSRPSGSEASRPRSSGPRPTGQRPSRAGDAGPRKSGPGKFTPRSSGPRPSGPRPPRTR